MVIDVHAKNQVSICKCVGKKSGKLKLRTDRRIDGRTECKPTVPFGFAGRGLKRQLLLLHELKTIHEEHEIFLKILLICCIYSTCTVYQHSPLFSRCFQKPFSKISSFRLIQIQSIYQHLVQLR